MSERTGKPAPVPPSNRPGGSHRALPRLHDGDGLAAERPASEQLPPAELIPGVWAGREAASGLRRRRGRGWGRRSVSTGRWLAEWLVVLTVALLAAVGVKTYVFQAFSIPSTSMSPTLEKGDRVVVSKLSTTFSPPDRGAVVVFRKPPTYRPGDPAAPTHLIKRVIGIPGDTVASSGGRVHIDGKPLDEPWLADGVRTLIDSPIKVPPGQLLMLGDNREGSEDGRLFGTVDSNLVEGRAVLTIWPPSRLGGL